MLDDRVWATIEAEQFRLIIIDAWASFYSGEENSNDQTEAALLRLQELSDTTGVAVVIVHHFGKSNEGREPEDLWRGASRLADWANRESLCSRTSARRRRRRTRVSNRLRRAATPTCTSCETTSRPIPS